MPGASPSTRRCSPIRSKLSVYSTSPLTPTGDNTRSDFLFSQLTSRTFTYSPSTGLGSAAQPFKGTISNYLQQFISQQGNASTLATQLQQGQSVVVNTLQQKFNSTSAVNIDTEMSNLIRCRIPTQPTPTSCRWCRA